VKDAYKASRELMKKQTEKKMARETRGAMNY
jgi:hypothetical protein